MYGYAKNAKKPIFVNEKENQSNLIWYKIDIKGA